MDIIVTLAGHSRRFKEKGYNKPKFILEIDNKPILYWVVRMFDRENDTFHFILNKNQKNESENLINTLKSLAKKVSIYEIDSHEFGPVYSVLSANLSINNYPVIISYCDFYVVWDYKKFLETAKYYDGAIPSFRGFHPASFGNTYYAYTRQDENNELIELREKKSFTDKRHLEYANTGIYYFKDFNLFKKYAKKLQTDGFGNLKEGYVSLIFNHMVKDGHKIKITDVDKFICLGTPEDLEEFYKWENIIKTKKKFEITSDFDKKNYEYWGSFFNNDFKFINKEVL